MLKIDASDRTLIGTDQIAAELSALLHVTGTMISNNIFCVEQGDLALLRADWKLVADDGSVHRIRQFRGNRAPAIRWFLALCDRPCDRIAPTLSAG